MFKSSQLQKEKKRPETSQASVFRAFNQLKNMRMTVKL